MTRLAKQVLPALAALLAVLGGAFAYRHYARGGEREEYATAPVERGPIEVSVTATGTVNPVATVQVGSYVSGPVQKIYVDFNSQVSKGQLVAQIDPQPFQLRVKQAEANLANARARAAKSRADLRLKEINLQRIRSLFSKALVPRSDLDAAETDVEQARAQVELDEAAVLQAQAALEEAQVNLGYTRIVSPVDGIVVRRDVDVGQTVAASFQTPTLFLIAEDLTNMQVDANVSESDIGGVREGLQARFTVDAYPGRMFSGTVRQVRNAPLVVQNVVTYDVVIAVDNSDLALKPGMTASVTIVTARRDGVLRIPAAALRFRPLGSSVPEVRPAEGVVWRHTGSGAPEPVSVRVGIANEEFAEVAEGELREGDRVVLARKSSVARRPIPRLLGVPQFRPR